MDDRPPRSPPPRPPPPPRRPAAPERPRTAIAPPGSASAGRPRVAPPGSATSSAPSPAGSSRDDDALGYVAAAAMAHGGATGALRPAVDNRTRRQRFAESDAAPTSPATCHAAAPIPEQPRLGVLIVTRNSGELLAERWRAWRPLLPGFEVRASVLDLGSIDDTWEVAERERLEVIGRPGGLVMPLSSLLAALRHASTELVLCVDAATEPGLAAVGLVDAVRAGAAFAVAAGRAPGAMAVDRRQLPEGDLGAQDLIGFAHRAGLRVAVCGLLEVPPAAARTALVPRLWDMRRRSRIARRLRAWRWPLALG